MSLKKASWSRSSSPEPSHTYLPPPPVDRRNNPMALSNLLHPAPHAMTYRDYSNTQCRERVEPPQEQRQSRQTSYSYPSPYTSHRPNVEGYECYMGRDDDDDGSTDSSNYSPALSHASLSPTREYNYQGGYSLGSSYSRGRGDTRPSTATTSSSASPPTPRFAELLSPHIIDGSSPVRHQSAIRSATIYHRNNYIRRQDGARPFGDVKQGRHFCTYMQYKTNTRCSSWQDGYTTWYDLARHADSEHGPEEVELIDRGLLDFEQAQWIKSEEQRAAIKTTMGSMVCQYCGTCFASNRVDSIDRHIRKGACERAQEKQREKSSHHAATVHKKKGGKTAAQHTRR